ncbi:hypothetical protein SF83666_a40410 (plasmid) [Sinorhizobium fredii CCBAU 83666]|nr:hypothetical protein SF83666_a40410 [Sinorhizobium fredii CCBAU 83666]CCE98773.1 hypothetical protein SFHH103_04293 [Sinorhizobium fredii HH103]
MIASTSSVRVAMLIRRAIHPPSRDSEPWPSHREHQHYR